MTVGMTGWIDNAIYIFIVAICFFLFSTIQQLIIFLTIYAGLCLIKYNVS